MSIKSYLRYKIITSQNLRHRLRIFLFHRKVMFHSQDIQVFVFLTISWFAKSVTSWWVLVLETGYIFEYIFRTTTHCITKLGQLIYISKGNNFQESFGQFGGLGLSPRPFFNLATCSNYSITNYVKITVFHFFEKVNKWHFKMSNINY